MRWTIRFAGFDPDGSNAMGGGMKLRASIVVMCALSLVSVGCQWDSLPSTAQAGSTIALTIVTPDLLGREVGYGGTEFDDEQRGTMVAELNDGTSVIELVTRMTVPFNLAAGTGADVVEQLMLFADIPESTPPGDYDIYVYNRRTLADGTLAEDTPLLNGSITVLPHSIEVNGNAVVGEPTSGTHWCAGTNCANNGTPTSVIPPPRISVHLAVQPGQNPERLSTATVELVYPGDVIDLVSVVSHGNFASDHYWLEDDGAGTAYVHGVVLGDRNTNLGDFAVHFALDHGDPEDPDFEVLDPGDLTVQLVAATDQGGNDILGQFNTAASFKTIK